ncbi:cilia and flagella-associated protein 47-like isoform X2 [Pectinophora gossypiella]|uniref:cilia and flagella-associated protein 47-like isoform X2 n=1 Tax=Pectinophora gossypiella TaxID=13191 RepID=UPI00214ECC81|nr:cilia and flagella-associated protein 47-like isoform X2 [Pectinophora gossypiella]
MSDCEAYDPNNVFKRFKLFEFPISFVGLSTTLPLDLEIDVTTSGYFKTINMGSLMKFDEARAISASHRAFSIEPLNKRTLEITFKPTNECIAKALKQKKMLTNRFIFDLRLIQVDGVRCCNNEYHSEIARFYISGEFEYCELRHSPKILDFGEVVMTTKVSRSVRIRNESNFVAAKVNYTKTTGYNVYPESFVLPPNSSKRVVITLNPNSLKINKTLIFQVRNPHHVFEEPTSSAAPLTDTNFLSYAINVLADIIFNGKPKIVVVKSLQTLHEPHPCYTYLDEELVKRNQRMKVADRIFQLSKVGTIKKHKEKYSCKKQHCIPEITVLGDKKRNFCEQFIKVATAPDLFEVSFDPFLLDFGRVGVQTYGEKSLTIKNNSKYDMIIKFLEDEYIVYTDNKLKHFTVKLIPEVEVTITIFCFGFITGNFKGTFAYTIDYKHFRKHRYTIVVGNPLLHIKDTHLKFGMVSSEGFVTTVPVTIYNNFNVPVDFEWATIGADVPFEIIPTIGTIPEHKCKICDILYNYKIAKCKTFEVDFYSKGEIEKVIPVEVSILSRKLSIKFLQPAVMFKDIGLNLETFERVKLENSSKEIALFHVIEPLLPGMTVEPMAGIIRPRSVINFIIKVKIACVLEFTFDLIIRINNKENVGLTIAGNVIEPKLNIHPKNIYMPRIPSCMVSYVPVNFHNTGPTRCTVHVVDTFDENIFNVYTTNGNDKQRIHDFSIEAGQAKVVFIKVCDVFRREYDMYIPFKINDLLGPPNNDPWSTQLEYYISDYEKQYESNLKTKVKSLNKDISFCHITGVITVPWIEFSVEKFEIEFDPTGDNSIEFTMTNVSRYYLHVCILTSKLSPNFTLDLTTEGNESIINDTNMKFELDRTREASFRVTFHPRYEGKFIAVAPLYLDKALAIQYSNLTFIGKRQNPIMKTNIDRIIFPPTYVGSELSRYLTLRLEEQFNDLEGFHCSSKEEPNVHVDFVGHENIPYNDEIHTLAEVKITICCETTYSRNLKLIFHHECGATCDVIINFCFTYCPLTLHAHSLVVPEENPYPYFPESTQKDFCTYLESCTRFVERWMFQQGFRRDLYPRIPDTFHAIATSMVSSLKVKGMNISFLHFFKRISGPLMKHIHKVSYV